MYHDILFFTFYYNNNDSLLTFSIFKIALFYKLFNISLYWLLIFSKTFYISYIFLYFSYILFLNIVYSKQLNPF